MVNGFYFLKTHDNGQIQQTISNTIVKEKHSQYNNINPMQLWHLRLGYINENRIAKLDRHGLINNLGSESGLTCESYILGKMTKFLFV